MADGDGAKDAVAEGGRMLTTNEALKELNARLGITDRDSMLTEYEAKSVEEMLESSRREFEEFSRTIAERKRDVEDATGELKEAFEDGVPSDAESATTAITTFRDSLESMTGLIRTGEDLMMQLVAAIKATDIVDPDVVSSTASIIEGIRIGIADIINYNTEKMKLAHQYRLAMDSERLKQRHRLELEYFKSELRMKEAEKKAEMKRAEEDAKKVIDVPAESAGGPTWSQVDVMDAIRKSEAERAARS